ncbi:Rv1733c family protein [Cryptosporangium japonicum]|uniref:Integral membrane protein n=1 Tax=Cryptosporangium japonicum TaxID=80872 RepID=A0ABN0TIX3_9ACTN
MGRYSPIRRTLRRIGFGRSPLRRGVDRADEVVGLLTTALAVGLVITAAVLGTTSYRVAADQRARELTHRHVVTVELQADTVSPPTATNAPVYRQRLPVEARWTDATGAVRRGDVYPWSAGYKGDRTPVWFDESGTPVRPLTSTGDLRARAWTGALAAVGIGGLVLFAVYSTARAVTDRRRYAAWTAEWTAVSGHWRHRI